MQLGAIEKVLQVEPVEAALVEDEAVETIVHVEEREKVEA